MSSADSTWSILEYNILYQGNGFEVWGRLWKTYYLGYDNNLQNNATQKNKRKIFVWDPLIVCCPEFLEYCYNINQITGNLM